MDRLPVDVQRLIYSMDPTYHRDAMICTLHHLKLCASLQCIDHLNWPVVVYGVKPSVTYVESMQV